MSLASSEVLDVLIFLLPGFVAAAIFYSLTSFPKPSAFDRVIQALIFTVVGQPITGVIVLLYDSTTEDNALWTKNLEIALSISVAVVLALAATWISNSDIVHSILRYVRVTKETSYPSEWYSAFARHHGCYVVLHLKGQRRLYGWPEEWPSSPDEGHFRIAEGEWLVEGKPPKPATGVSAILIPASEVEMVEFLSEHFEKPER